MESMKSQIPFHCLITGPTNCGKTKFLVDTLKGSFRYVFDVIILIFPTFAMNKTYHSFVEMKDPNFFVMDPEASQNDEVEECLKIIHDLFHDNDKENVLIILDDCAVSSDVKKRSSKLIDLAFSGRHIGISVWILTQQLNSIAKPFRENLGLVVSFHNPEKDSIDTLFSKFCSDISTEEKKNICKILKENRYSKSLITLRHPYSFHIEIPSTNN